MRTSRKWVLWAALLLTGFAALGLQVVWQRTVSLHIGADSAATAVVVSGFLAGLGIGNLIGGRIADRVGDRAALKTLAAAEGSVAVFAFASIWLLHDLFVDVAPTLSGSPVGAVLTFALLLVPTTLMGLSLPLAARLMTASPDAAGTEVGRLYAVNTFGGAVGALAVGWYLVGNFGFVATTRVCGAISLAASAMLLVLAGSLDPSEWSRRPVVPAGSDERRPVRSSVLPWYVLYGVSGALALGLQQTFFRLVSATSRSNSYSFATVLALYLATFAIGAAIGSLFVRRVSEPGRVFLWLQFGVGAAALASMIVLTSVLGDLGMADRLDEWFNSDGFASGYDLSDDSSFILFAVLLPMLIVCPAVLLMGASFPFVERVVVDRLASVGRRTGGLMAANTFGNVIGVLVTAFVVFDLAGTAGTVRLLAAMLIAAGVVAIALGTFRPTRVLLGGTAVVGAMALVFAAPDNQRLWEFFSGNGPDAGVIVAEDAACASVIEPQGEAQFQLSINGATQNGYPYDDFHVLIGLLPTLLAEEAPSSLAVGFGIGSTSYAMLADRDAQEVTSVELCGGHYEVADQVAEQDYAEFVALRDDPRHERVVADGRNHLLASDDRYDAVVVDTLRVTSAFSGQHFSREFYELVADSLADDGVLAQWVPTWRVQNSAAQVFTHLVTASVPEYNDSVFMLGSNSPIDISALELARRFDERAADAFPPEQRARLRAFLTAWTPTCVTQGSTVGGVPGEFENRDLFPRDEFHMNNGFIGETQTYGSCV